MANRDTIYKELIQLDWEVKDQDEFFDKMTDKLLELGYVKDTFRDREYHQTIYRMYKIKRYD